MDKFKRLLASRKFWAALVGLALVVLKSYRPEFPLSEDQVTGLVVVIVGYILGVAVEDAGVLGRRVDVPVRTGDAAPAKTGDAAPAKTGDTVPANPSDTGAAREEARP